jgi:hypothetical protein
MLKRKSPSHTAKRGTAEVDFGVGLVPMFPTQYKRAPLLE